MPEIVFRLDSVIYRKSRYAELVYSAKKELTFTDLAAAEIIVGQKL